MCAVQYILVKYTVVVSTVSSYLQCVFLGLMGGTIVFMADLYFLVRTDLVSPNYSRGSKPSRKQKKD